MSLLNNPRARWALAVPAAVAVVVSASPASATTEATRINSAEQSTNWSGYGTNVTETGLTNSYKSIGGSWVVPAVSAETPGQAEHTSTWIGIGGNTLNSAMVTGDPTLIQTGTEQEVAAGGATTYYAWYEILPEPETEITSLTVHPGDLMQANIKQGLPEVWTITITDATTGGSFTTSTPYPSLMDTAEWIHEAPTLIGVDAGVATLADSSPVRFSGSRVNGAAVNLHSADQIQMTDATGKVIAQPSAPDSTGSGFQVCVYSGTSCAAP